MSNIPNWMIPGNQEKVRLRDLAIVSDSVRGMTKLALAKKYRVTQGRLWQLVGQFKPTQKGQGWKTRRYAAMRREQLQMLQEYPRVFAEIMER